MVHEPSGLSKSVWTNLDFDLMGWHDSVLHGIALGATDDDDPDLCLTLDLDYIVQWVDGAPTFSFWLAPVSLVFENAWNLRLEGTIEQMDSAELLDLHHLRHFANPAGVEFDEGHVEGDGFDIRVDATSFTQYFRRPPILTESQWLSDEDRGGVSFDRVPFDSRS